MDDDGNIDEENFDNLMKLAEMMKKFNISYKTAGENIGKGQKTPAQVVNAWMNSQGHRENILNKNYTEIGIGVAKDAKGTLYWTQMFIGK